MAEETTIYEQGTTKVTNLRAVFGEKTYAVSNITAVEMKIQPASPFLPMIFLAIGGCLLVTFLSSVTNSSSLNAAVNTGIKWTNLFIGLIVGGLGVLVIRSSKDTYIVQISASSGEVKALTSTDKTQITGIVEAINQAIIQKG